MSGAESIPLRVGLLVVDSIDEPHRRIAGDYFDLFEGLLAPHGVDLVSHDGRSSDLPGSDTCDGWIVPGSRASVHDDLHWRPRLTEWVLGALDSAVPLVGVCFGHQLIAQALGAPVAKSELGWNVGAIGYDVLGAPPGAPHTPASFRILASHQDQVLELPPGATLLASAPTCPIAAYSYGGHVYCVQGHPEFVPEQAASIYSSRIEQLGRDTYETAMRSLDRSLDNDLVGAWIATAIRSAAELTIQSAGGHS